MERDPINPEIQYQYFTSPSPSEAHGSYRGKEFYLYARWDTWYFVLSENPDIEPDLLFLMIDCDLEQFSHERIETFKNASFIRSATYGEPNGCEASYLSDEEKMEIIRNCIAEYEGAG